MLQKVSYANANEMAATARKVMSSRGDIFIDTRSNTLVIKELPDYLPTVLDLIKNLDIASPQVMIEARIVEANRTFSNAIGVVWGFNGVADAAHGNTTGLVFPNSGTVAGNVSLPSGAPQVLHLSLANVLNTFKLDAALHAAESRGLVKVVSTPKVQTQTGEEASIQSGFQIPVQTTVNNTTSVLYINATLRLDVTPQITNEGTVIMDITIQKREPAVGINIAGGQNIPLTTRDAKTRLMVRDGGTAVIGGIFKITTNDGQSMIPGLWKIPILGNLFRSRDQTREHGRAHDLHHAADHSVRSEPMKKRFSTLAAVLAAVSLAALPGCSTNTQGDNASPVFLAGDFELLPLQKCVDDNAPLQFQTTTLREPSQEPAP